VAANLGKQKYLHLPRNIIKHMITDLFYAIGESVNPMLEILPQLGNAPNALIVSAGIFILVACTNMLIKAKREGAE
jgi:hypothetical protein